MPGPSSRPRSRPRPASALTDARTGVPGGVCVRAFSSRLASTWRRRSVAGHDDGPGRRDLDRSRPGVAAARPSTASRDGGQVDRIALERAALVEAGEQQQVVDEHAHARRLALDAAHRLRQVVGAVGGAAPEQLGVAADRRERRAQLVRRVGDEPAQALPRTRRALLRTPPRSARASRSARARAGRPRCARRRARRGGTGRRPRSRPRSRPSARAAAARAARPTSATQRQREQHGRSPRPVSTSSELVQRRRDVGQRDGDDQRPAADAGSRASDAVARR